MQGVDSRYAWWRLAASMTLSAFGAVGMWGVVVVFPALQAEFGASRAEVSFSYTTTMLGFGAGVDPVRPDDRHARRLRDHGAVDLC